MNRFYKQITIKFFVSKIYYKNARIERSFIIKKKINKPSVIIITQYYFFII